MRTNTPTRLGPIAVAAVVTLTLVAGSLTLPVAAGAGAGDSQMFDVTAGADAQAPIDGDGGTTLQLGEGDTAAFPTEGTASLSIPGDADVRIDTDASDPEVRAEGSSDVTVSAVRIEDDRTVAIDVENASAEAAESLSIHGLRFSVPANATETTATFRFGDAATAVQLAPERLTARLDASPIPRGVDGVPEEPRLLVDARDANSSGFHAEGERMAVYVPSAERDRLSFDTRSRPEIELFGEGCSSEADSFTRLLPSTGDRGLTEYAFFFEVDCDVDAENAVMISDLRFNTTGAGMDDPAEFDAALAVESVPVNATDEVVVDTDDSLSVVAPAVSGRAEEVVVAPNESGVTGDDPARVSITDDTGGLLADGSEVVVTLEGSGASFDRSQPLSVEADGVEATPTSISASQIVVSVGGTSEAGDSITIGGGNGDGLAFNTTDEGSSRLAVTTSAGGDSVTQETDTTISVSGRSEGGDDGTDGGDGPADGDDGIDGGNTGGGVGDGTTGDGSDADDAGGTAKDGTSTRRDGSGSFDADTGATREGDERRPLVDDSPDQAGVTVQFETAPFETITFGEDATSVNGEVAVSPLETLPEGVHVPPGETIVAIDVAVPDALRDASATLRLSVDADALGSADPREATLYHYDADVGEWEPLETTVSEASDETIFFEATTDGFSPFALQIGADDGTTTRTKSTDGSATRSQTDTDEAAPEVSSIGGDPLVPLVLGVVAVLVVGFLVRRLD